MKFLIKKLSELCEKFGSSTIIVLMLVYSAQGLRSLGSQAQTLYFKNTFKLNPSELSLLRTLFDIAFYMKPIYGLLSDTFPIKGYHRKSYLLISGILGMGSYFLIFISNNIYLSAFGLTAGTYSLAIADSISDGLMVEKARIDPENGASTLQRIS